VLYFNRFITQKENKTMPMPILTDSAGDVMVACHTCGEYGCIGECIDFLQAAMLDYDPSDDFDDARAIDDEQYRNY
jgi:hypothetical protein